MSEPVPADTSDTDKGDEKNGCADTNTEKCDRKTDKLSTEIKTVSSANDWESANLGDDARKEKFLKLMGAAKNDHKGKIVIGDTDSATKHKADNPDDLNKGLEDQFQHGLDHKLKSGFKGHLGLGFTQEEEQVKKSGTDAPPPSADGDKAKDIPEEIPDKSGEKRPAAADPAAESAAVPKKKSMMMNFVKASDS